TGVTYLCNFHLLAKQNARSPAMTEIRDISVKDLIDAGFIRAPVTVYGIYRGSEIEARLNEDGTFEAAKGVYASPSVAAGQATTASRFLAIESVTRTTMNFIENETEQKLRGGYYTPPDLAKFLARWVMGITPNHILEPSCGDGAFFHAVHATEGFKNVALTGF